MKCWLELAAVYHYLEFVGASDFIRLTLLLSNSPTRYRWFGGYFEGGQIIFTEEWKDFYSFYMRNYHAFFDRAYDIGEYIEMIIYSCVISVIYLCSCASCNN